MSKWKKITWDILSVLIPALLLFLAFKIVIPPHNVHGPSMIPSLYAGEYVIVNKAIYWFGKPRRGDIVVYHSGKRARLIIHRIVGLPGDNVRVKEGKLYIDGEYVKEPYTRGHSVSVSVKKVPRDCYFIIGDNRNAADWEIVPREDIVGKAWICYWPISRWGKVPNYPLKVKEHQSLAPQLTPEPVYAILNLPIWAGSSVEEHRTFNPGVVGSNPARLSLDS